MKRQTVKFCAALMAAVSLTGSITADAKVLTSKNDIYQEMHDKMTKRAEDFTITVKGKQAEKFFRVDLSDLSSKVFAIDDKSTTDDGGYLANVRSNMSVQTSLMGDVLEMNVKVNYLENKSQTKKVNSKVKKILKGLKLSGKRDIEKIRAVNDWIVKHVEYDHSLSRYSAYNALYGSKKTVCQGYALLTYKLLNEAGVPCEIVSGKADNTLFTDDHAWNIVKVDDKWYTLDVCWNDTGVTDDYFVIGSRQSNKDHYLDAEYKTKKFKKAHPMAKSSYF